MSAVKAMQKAIDELAKAKEAARKRVDNAVEKVKTVGKNQTG